MYHLIYDYTDITEPFMLIETSESCLTAHHWFSYVTLNLAFDQPYNIITSLDEYLNDTPWEILTTFPTRPSMTELTTFIQSKPELLI